MNRREMIRTAIVTGAAAAGIPTNGIKTKEITGIKEPILVIRLGEDSFNVDSNEMERMKEGLEKYLSGTKVLITTGDVEIETVPHPYCYRRRVGNAEEEITFNTYEELQRHLAKIGAAQ